MLNVTATGLPLNGIGYTKCVLWYDSLDCNFGIKQAVYFSVGGSICKRGNMQQVAQESVRLYP
jgi:hypothetical protein